MLLTFSLRTHTTIIRALFPYHEFPSQGLSKRESHSLLPHHSPQLRPLTPPNPIQINIHNLKPLPLLTLMRRFPRPRNPRNIKRYINSPKPLYSTLYTIFKGFLITYIKLSGLDCHIWVFGFDGG